MRIVYRPNYNLPIPRFARAIHPFDLRKYGRAYRELTRAFGRRMRELTTAPERQVSPEELSCVHSAAYLARLSDSAYLARAVEVPILSQLPAKLLDWGILRPMRWATRGTVLATREALSSGLAVNLGGGFHHAKPEAAEGFCVYADIALAVETARRDGSLGRNDRFVYIDLDVHQGNGVCYCFRNDSSAFLFDMYHAAIYPAGDREAIERIDCKIPLAAGCRDEEYLGILRDRLPGFLESAGNGSPIKLAIYNAGTDIYEGDSLGGLSVTADGVLERDRLVVGQLWDRGIPTVMLTSGGYSEQSYQLIARSVRWMIETYAPAA